MTNLGPDDRSQVSNQESRLPAPNPPVLAAGNSAEQLMSVGLLSKLSILGIIVLPLLGLAAAVVLAWGWGVTWVDLGLLAGLYLLTAVGITVGFHRLFVHGSFDTFTPVKVVLAALGSMAIQGSLMHWAARHRRHHQHSDTAHDPHSPHRYGGGLTARLWGLWHAHIGWAFGPHPRGLSRYVRDLRRSFALRLTSALFPAWAVLGLVVPAVLGGLLSGSWSGALTGFVWGGLVRLFLVHHVTWSVNSAGHLWGSRPFKCPDHSRNNFILGVLALGEGWHNSHHAFPTSARHGLRWWQPDVSYYLIRLLWLVGLAWNVKVPSRAAQARAGRLAVAG
jgi:stearoyl-CoA desaturase (delta-9 desaturase)